jgi:O-antigen/teichoic acid export membrane protein
MVAGPSKLNQSDDAHAFLYAGMKLLPMVVSVLGTILLARQIPLTEFGRYSRAFAFTQVVTTVGLLGQDQLALRGSISPTTALRRSGAIAAVSAVAAVSLAWLTVEVDMLPLVAVVVITAAVSTCLTLVLVIRQHLGFDLERARAELILKSANQSGLNLGGFARGTALAVALGGALGTGLWSASALRGKKWRSLHRRRWGADTFLTGLKFGLPGMLYGLAAAIPLLAIAAQADEAANAQARFVALTYLAMTALAAAFNGEFFRTRLFAAADSGARLEIWHRMRRTLILAAGVVSLGVFIAGLVLPKLLGSAYHDASTGMLLLAIGVPFQLFGSAYGSLLLTNGRVRETMLRQAMAVMVALVLSLSLRSGPLALAGIFVINDVLAFGLYLTMQDRWGVASLPRPPS